MGYLGYSVFILPMKQESFDPGLTTQFSGALRRAINKDGSFNVHRKGMRWRDANVYLKLIDTTWPRFLIAVAGGFLLVNMVFAATYMLLGVEHLQGLEPEMSRFMNAFFFSIHTLTTVGYGNVYPRGMGANMVAAIEAATGLMVFAIATGLLYGRFSRPSARILFSDHLLVAPYQDGTSLQFRITNARSNVLMDLEARVLMMTVTVCLAFPDAYEIGMSHTGTKILYEIVNRRPGWACERTYAPWVDFEAVLRREKVPLFSVESFAPVSDFDVVGFSLQSELNYTNVPNMLELSGIPVLASDRGDADPIVIGGGPCTANPEPLADFFDVFLIGDAEEALPVFLERVAATVGLPRRERLLAFTACPGIYAPSFYDVVYGGDRVVSTVPNAPGVSEKANRVWVEKLSADVYPDKPMVPSVDIIQDRLGLEIMRGCTQGCRFCQAGYWYRPVRELDPADVAKATVAFIDEAGWSEVGLLSLSSADYSQIEPLVACLAPELAKTKVSISLPSLRAEAFSVGLADAVSEVRKSGFAFAPETGSDRLRRVINKTFTNADMVKADLR